jgi:hypothetical protein
MPDPNTELRDPTLLDRVRSRVQDPLVLCVAAGTFAVIGVVGLAAYESEHAFGSDTETIKGTVELGVDNKKYVIPDGSEQPVFWTRQACIANVDDIDTPKPAALCQPVREHTNSTTENPITYWYGPVVNEKINGLSRWNSPDIISWQKSIVSRTFPVSHDALITEELFHALSNAKVGDENKVVVPVDADPPDGSDCDSEGDGICDSYDSYGGDGDGDPAPGGALLLSPLLPLVGYLLFRRRPDERDD